MKLKITRPDGSTEEREYARLYNLAHHGVYVPLLRANGVSFRAAIDARTAVHMQRERHITVPDLGGEWTFEVTE